MTGAIEVILRRRAGEGRGSASSNSRSSRHVLRTRMGRCERLAEGSRMKGLSKV